jgi:hypothetical protein
LLGGHHRVLHAALAGPVHLPVLHLGGQGDGCNRDHDGARKGESEDLLQTHHETS